MKRLIFQVYVSHRSKLYDVCTESVKQYATSIGVDYHCQTTPKLKVKPDLFQSNRSRESWEKYGGYIPIFEKENFIDYLKDYDQICIIDGDIWIRPDSPNVFDQFNSDYDMAAVYETEMPTDQSYSRRVKQYAMEQLAPMPQFDWNGNHFFNSGMLIYDNNIKPKIKQKTAREFIDRIDFQDFINGKGPWKWQGDQIMLNYFAKKEKINVQHLDFKWNCLYNPYFGGIDLKLVKQSHFIHFFQAVKLREYAKDVEGLIKLVS